MDTRRKRRQTEDSSAVADELERFQDARLWPGTGEQLPTDIAHAAKKRDRTDAYNFECLNAFTLIAIFAGVSATGVIACLATLYRSGMFGDTRIRLEWLIPFIVLSSFFLCSLCCCAGFKMRVKSDLEPHIQVRIGFWHWYSQNCSFCYLAQIIEPVVGSGNTKELICMLLCRRCTSCMLLTGFLYPQMLRGSSFISWSYHPNYTATTKYQCIVCMQTVSMNHSYGCGSASSYKMERR